MTTVFIEETAESAAFKDMFADSPELVELSNSVDFPEHEVYNDEMDRRDYRKFCEQTDRFPDFADTW